MGIRIDDIAATLRQQIETDSLGEERLPQRC